MKKKLPQRPRSHIQQKESRLFVERILPKEWILEEKQHDYGIDLVVEIVENNDVTGMNFLIQLKSTDNLIINKKGLVSHACKTSTLRYFLERTEPVIYLVYDSINDTGYWIWVQDFLQNQPDSSWKKKNSFTIKIPQTNVFNKKTIDVIKKRVFRLHRKDKLVNAIDSITHPAYKYGLEFIENTTKISVFSKYKGAEQDYPLEFGLVLDFGNSEEGEKTKKAWEDAFKKGTPAEIKAPFIKEFKIPKEFDFENLLFGSKFKSDSLKIQPIKRDRKWLARIDVFNKQDKLVAQVPYIDFREIRYGSDEVLMSNDGQEIPSKFSLLLKTPERECVFSFKLNYVGWNVSQVKDIFNLQHALSSGGWLKIIDINTNMEVLRFDFLENLVSIPLDVHVEIANELSGIQQKTNIIFLWPDKISWEDYGLIKELSRIINNGEVSFGRRIATSFDKSSAKRLLKSFSKNERMNFLIDGQARDIYLFNRKIELGPARILLNSAKLSKKTMKKLNTLESIKDNGRVKIEFEVDEPGITAQYLNWLPKRKENSQIKNES